MELKIRLENPTEDDIEIMEEEYIDEIIEDYLDEIEDTLCPYCRREILKKLFYLGFEMGYNALEEDFDFDECDCIRCDCIED